MRLLVLCLLGTSAAFGQISFGLRGGVPLTDFYHLVSSGGATFQSGSTRFILGPTIEVHLPAGFGIEADALYRHFSYNATGTLADTSVNTKANSAWEFPLLIKYRVPTPVVRPFLDAGFAFDRWSGVKQITNAVGLTKSDVSGVNTGVVLGGGLELKLPFIKISPEIRFTRWGAKNISDLGGVLHLNQNQAEFLIGLTF
jgi:opacity protein-like surface antigen